MARTSKLKARSRSWRRIRDRFCRPNGLTLIQALLCSAFDYSVASRYRKVSFAFGDMHGVSLLISPRTISTISLVFRPRQRQISTSKSDPEVHLGRCAARSDFAIFYPFFIYDSCLPPTINLPSSFLPINLLFRTDDSFGATLPASYSPGTRTRAGRPGSVCHLMRTPCCPQTCGLFLGKTHFQERSVPRMLLRFI